MSSVQVFFGFSNFSGEVAMPATLFCFWEIDTETRDSDSPPSQLKRPLALTAPSTILSDDSKLDRMVHLPCLDDANVVDDDTVPPLPDQRGGSARRLDFVRWGRSPHQAKPHAAGAGHRARRALLQRAGERVAQAQGGRRARGHHAAHRLLHDGLGPVRRQDHRPEHATLGAGDRAAARFSSGGRSPCSAARLPPRTSPAGTRSSAGAAVNLKTTRGPRAASAAPVSPAYPLTRPRAAVPRGPRAVPATGSAPDGRAEEDESVPPRRNDLVTLHSSFARLRG